MRLKKENEKGKVYQAEGFKIYYRNKGAISGDNEANPNELIYLISGSGKVTLKGSSWNVEAPAKIEFPAKTPHKLEALTDITFILFEK